MKLSCLQPHLDPSIHLYKLEVSGTYSVSSSCCKSNRKSCRGRSMTMILLARSLANEGVVISATELQRAKMSAQERTFARFNFITSVPVLYQRDSYLLKNEERWNMKILEMVVFSLTSSLQNQLQCIRMFRHYIAANRRHSLQLIQSLL